MCAPVISIIIPIYGVERYIGRFAESVLGQKYPHIQFVFVNDGTKDNSMQILDDLIKEKYSHLKERIIIINKENGGLPSARKIGMKYVTGDYVWHIDSDDWIEEDAVQKIADFTVSQNFPDVIYFDFFKEYTDKTKLKREREYTTGEKDKYIINMFNHDSYACVWNKCVRRRVYIDNEVAFPRFSYAEDTYLTTQLVGYADRICHLAQPLYHYRKDNPLAITRQNSRKRHREYALNFLDLYERYKDVPMERNPVSVILRQMLRRVRWYNLIYHLGIFRKR